MRSSTFSSNLQSIEKIELTLSKLFKTEDMSLKIVVCWDICSLNWLIKSLISFWRIERLVCDCGGKNNDTYSTCFDIFVFFHLRFLLFDRLIFHLFDDRWKIMQINFMKMFDQLKIKYLFRNSSSRQIWLGLTGISRMACSIDVKFVSISFFNWQISNPLKENFASSSPLVRFDNKLLLSKCSCMMNEILLEFNLFFVLFKK